MSFLIGLGLGVTLTLILQTDFAKAALAQLVAKVKNKAGLK